MTIADHVIIKRCGDGDYRVQLQVGNQYFWISDACDEKDAAQFIRNMLLVALKKLIEEN